MVEESRTILSNMAANPIVTAVKDEEKTIDYTIEPAVNDTDNLFIDPLIEPVVVAMNNDESVDISQHSRTIAQRFSGILYALLAAFFYTASIFITKQLKVDLFDVLIPRFVLQTVMLIIYMKCIKHYSLYKQCQKKEILFLIIYLFFCTTAFCAFLLGYHYLPLPELTTIRYTQVIWTAILTAIIYCEKPSIPVISGVLLTIAGVILVAQPNFLFEKTSNITKISEKKILNDHDHQRLLGLLLVLYTSVAMSIALIANKHLLQKYKTKHSLIMLQLTFISSCIMIGNLVYKYYFITEKIESLKNDFLNWRYILASCICLSQIISSILTQKALKREHPSIFTIVQSGDILFSILLQNCFTSNKSNFLSLFGSILVLMSILIVAGFKFINTKKTKKKFSPDVI